MGSQAMVVAQSVWQWQWKVTQRSFRPRCRTDKNELLFANERGLERSICDS